MTAQNQNIYYLQGEKRLFAETVEKYEEIKNPTLYHMLAYRYALDTIINRATVIGEEVAALHTEITDTVKQQDLSSPLPPIISERIDEIMRVYMEDNPNLTETEKHNIIGGMFMDGGEFFGLFNEKDGTVNQDWLDAYLADPENQPQRINITFTPEMTEDAIAIVSRDDLTDEEKDDMVSAMFAAGGKYEGYIQPDGSVDETKIKGYKPKTEMTDATDETPF